MRVSFWLAAVQVCSSRYHLQLCLVQLQLKLELEQDQELERENERLEAGGEQCRCAALDRYHPHLWV